MHYIAGSSCGEYESNPKFESATRRWSRKDWQGTGKTKKTSRGFIELQTRPSK